MARYNSGTLSRNSKIWAILLKMFIASSFIEIRIFALPTNYCNMHTNTHIKLQMKIKKKFYPFIPM